RRGALWLFSVGPWAGRGVVPAGSWPVLRRTAGAALSASTHYGSQAGRPCLTDGALTPDRWGRSCPTGGWPIGSPNRWSDGLSSALLRDMAAQAVSAVSAVRRWVSDARIHGSAAGSSESRASQRCWSVSPYSRL